MMLVEINFWFPAENLCSETLMGCSDPPSVVSLGGSLRPCIYADGRAVLMTSSHSDRPTNMKNFQPQPSVSVRMVAVLKCIGSLGGAVAAQVYTAFIAPHQEGYVLFAAIAAPALCLGGAPMLRLRPPTSGDGILNDAADSARLHKTFGLLAVVVPGE